MRSSDPGGRKRGGVDKRPPFVDEPVDQGLRPGDKPSLRAQRFGKGANNYVHIHLSFICYRRSAMESRPSAVLPPHPDRMRLIENTDRAVLPGPPRPLWERRQT